jgi:rod shape-determining protein MreC
MQQIIYFIKKFRYFLLFLFLEVIALFLIVQHHSFHSSKFIHSANAVSGYLFERKTAITEFINLKQENERLNRENAQLKNLLLISGKEIDTAATQVIDSSEYSQQYKIRTVKVVNNDFRRQNNYLTINKGSNHGLRQDQGVITGEGIIGVIKNLSGNYATVLSILNTNSRINVRLKHSNHFGTMLWNGQDYRIVQIVDIPRQAVIAEGDTLISGGRSAIFPEGIPIGSIRDYTLRNNQYETINVELFTDMSALTQVQTVANLLREEQLDLEEKTQRNE